MQFDVILDHKNEYRWTLKASNGEPIAVSSEGYTSKHNCITGIELTKLAHSAKVIDHTLSAATILSGLHKPYTR